MSDPVTRNINASVQKTFEWLKDVEDALGLEDRQVAYHAMRAVLHALRDRLIPDEACDLAEQLPIMLRGIFYEGWSPASKPDKMKREEFLERVGSETAVLAIDVNPACYVEAVFAVLQKRISGGEISDIRGSLPKDFAGLWPEDGLRSS